MVPENNPVQICWLCNATKGATNLDNVFTDISPNSGWRQSYLMSNPWTVVPSYASLIGFHLIMIMGDLLHICNLGISRDVAGCALRFILKDATVFPGATIPLRMESAMSSLRAFARLHGYSLRMKRFSKKKIAWKNNGYPELIASGSDTHIVLAWLETTLAPHANVFGDICTLIYALNRSMRLLYSAGMFLSEQERETVRTLGDLFARTYLCLALNSVQNHELMWRCRPKMHLFIEMMLCRRVINPAFYATWLDEDWLKKISKPLRLTAAKTAQRRILERWMLGIPEQLRQAEWKTEFPNNACWNHSATTSDVLLYYMYESDFFVEVPACDVFYLSCANAVKFSFDTTIRFEWLYKFICSRVYAILLFHPKNVSSYHVFKAISARAGKHK